MVKKDWELEEGQHIAELIEALESVFTSEDSLKLMLRLKLNASWEKFKKGETYRVRILNLIEEWAVAEGKVKQLVFASAYWGSDNIKMQKFIENHIENLLELDNGSLSKSSLVKLITILNESDNSTEILNTGKNILPGKIAIDRPQEAQALEEPKLSSWFKYFTLLKLLLEDYPLFEQRPSIFTFVKHLSRVAVLDDVTKQALSKWLDEAAPNFNRQSEKSVQPSTSSRLVSGGLQAYLMILANPEKAKLRASASLVCIAPTGTKKEIPVHLNSDANGVLTSRKKLPQIVAQFIQQVTSIELERPENRLGCAYYELTIELFLPINYLCEPVDRWEIKDDFDNPVSLGSKYRLVIRSYERVIKPTLRAYPKTQESMRRLQ